MTRVRIAVALKNSAKIAPSGSLYVVSLIDGTMNETSPLERAMKYDRIRAIVATEIHAITKQPRPGFEHCPFSFGSLILFHGYPTCSPPSHG